MVKFYTTWVLSSSVFSEKFAFFNLQSLLAVWQQSGVLREVYSWNSDLVLIYTVFQKKWRQNSNHYNYGISYQLNILLGALIIIFPT